MASWGAWLAVAGGGAIGSLARFWLTGVFADLTGARWPWGTLAINVLGSLVIGLVAGVALAPSRIDLHPDLRIFLMTGVCIKDDLERSAQRLELLQAGETLAAGAYILASVVLCLLAVWAGWSIGRPI